MTQTTRDRKPISKEEFTALYIFHGIFGFHYYSICEEASNLDRDLLENPEFMKDIFATAESLPYPCGEVLVMRLQGNTFKEISKALKIRKILAEEYEHKAWRLIRHPKYSKALIHYTESFKKWEDAYEETNNG
jgi:hypothetical protein